MTSVVKTIKRLFLSSVIFLLLAYIASINIEMSFIQINSTWLSNNFVFTLFSGLFVSTLVVLLCDLYDYFNKKQSFEQALISYYSNLYGHFLIAQYNLKRILDKQQAFYPQILHQQIPTLRSLLLTIQSIDYCTLCVICHNNTIEKTHKEFIQLKAHAISVIINNFTYLEVAAKTDEISLLQHKTKVSSVTDLKLTYETILKFINQIAIILKSIDDVLSTFEKEKVNDFQWQLLKTKMIDYENKFTSTDIDDFLKETIITF